LPKLMNRGMRDICKRVVSAAVVRHSGDDLLLHIYMAGVYHGAEMAAKLPAPEIQTEP
jgi:hypothetical protein